MKPRGWKVWVLGVLLGLSVARAQDPGPAATPAPATDADLRIRGIFESALPRTERKNSLRLIVHPHLGDFWEHTHLRTAIGFRYGLTSRWEATSEVDAYFSHGLREKSFFEEKGFSSLHLGTKYRLGDPLRIGWETAVGVDWSRPIGTPPLEVTDGLRHLMPFVSFSRQLAAHPQWRVFFGLAYEDIARTDTTGILPKNQLNDDNLGVSGGFLYTRGNLTYTFETAYSSEHPIRDMGRDLVVMRPGIVWVVPPRFTFGGQGRWLLGLSLKLSHGQDGYDVGAAAKLRVNFDFKRLLGRKKAASAER